MATIKIGVIADDFTGASDAASFLVKGGNRTILFTDIPNSFDYECDCIVMALKVRSAKPEEAISKVSKVLDFFEKISVEKVYFKYCSTFDSTPKGNIGVIMDYLIERMNEHYSILCPSLPVNGRTVEKGILYVNGVVLDQSPLKNHPLNPMWDSFIPTLMKDQSKYPCYILEENGFDQFPNNIPQKYRKNSHFYIVPDYSTDEHGKKIAKMFKNLRLLSGGSGLLEHIIDNKDTIQDDNLFDIETQKAVIVCGSCSEMTNKQVQKYKTSGNCFYPIDSRKLINNEITEDSYLDIINKNLPKASLLYSDGCEGNIRRDSDSFLDESKAMEEFLSNIAVMAKNQCYNKIVVAGGETSGAVTIKLGYTAFYVGKSVAPGVPVLTPLENQKIRIILKSGNFGDENFFMKALEAK